MGSPRITSSAGMLDEEPATGISPSGRASGGSIRRQTSCSSSVTVRSMDSTSPPASFQTAPLRTGSRSPSSSPGCGHGSGPSLQGRLTVRDVASLGHEADELPCLAEEHDCARCIAAVGERHPGRPVIHGLEGDAVAEKGGREADHLAEVPNRRALVHLRTAHVGDQEELERLDEHPPFTRAYMSRARTKGKRAHPERGVPDEPGWPYRVVLLRARSKPRLLNVRLHPARMGEANGPDDRPTDDAAVREVATGSDAPARASPWSVSSVMRSGGGVADFASRVSPSDRTSRANLRDPTNTAPPRGGQGRPADAKSVAAEPSVNGTRRRRSQLVSASLVTADGRAIGW